MTTLEIKVKEFIEPIINEKGYQLYDVIYEKEGKDYYLRIFIDKPEGIGLEDCENVNNAITDLLDEKNFIKEAYFLEVSSPGIERRIRTEEHLKNSIDKKINVHLYKAIEKKKEIEGILKKVNDSNIEILSDENLKKDNIIIEKNNISVIHTVYDWNASTK